MRTTDYEESYLREINRLILAVVWLHVPVSLALHFSFNQPSLLLTLGMGFLISLGPSVVYYNAPGSRVTSSVLSMALMGFSALYIHLARGMIELHFHIFTFIGVMIIFANPWPVLIGAVTVAVHHLTFFFLLPSSIFNYQASVGIVALHAAFVIIETIPASFIAMKFGRFIQAQGTISEQLSGISGTILKSAHKTQNNNILLHKQMLEEATHLQETAAGFEEIGTTCQKNADSANLSHTAAEETHSAALAGRKSIQEMFSFVETMGKDHTQILQQVAHSSDEISSVIKIITDIGTKTKVINEIVFQTKLLSFNASVEAARAGEHGKGFAVVAEEVGNLAQMSGKAALEISEMLEQGIARAQGIEKDIRAKSEGTIAAGNQKVENGLRVTRDCDHGLEMIVDNVAKVTAMVAEITKASNEQANAVHMMTDEMARLENINQENLNTFTDSTETSQSLAKDATHLHDLVLMLMNIVAGRDVNQGIQDNQADLLTSPEPEPDEPN